MNEQSDHQTERFPGFRSPNYTPVPDELFDDLMPELSGAELKVLLYIVRRTFGFKRDSDAISLSQMLTGIVKHDGERLDHGTGLTKKTLLKALAVLEEREIIFAERRVTSDRGNMATVYRLNVAVPQTLGGKITPPLGEKVAQGRRETPPRARGRNSATQETVEQETVEQDFDISNIRKASPGRSGGEGGVQDTETPPPAPEQTSPQGMESVGNVLVRQGRRAPRSRPRPETETTEYQRIQALIADRAREFADVAPLKSSTTRAWNLFQAFGVPIDVFESKIFQARALTQEATARITKTTEDPTYHVRRKSKMAYFFSTLEDQLNRRARPSEHPSEPSGENAADSPTPPRGRSKQSRPGAKPPGGSGRSPDREGPYGAWIKS